VLERLLGELINRVWLVRFSLGEPHSPVRVGS